MPRSGKAKSRCKKICNNKSPRDSCLMLYDFQKEDIKYWWENLNGRGGLAWSIGAGKTFSGALILGRFKELGKKVLVVAPPSLILDWQEEAAKHDVDLVHIAKKETAYTITTYAQLHKVRGKYDLLIGDEIHKIKSSTSKRGKIFQKLAKQTEKLLMMTGTPSQNNDVMELLNYLWAINSPEIQEWIPPNITRYKAEFAHQIVNGRNRWWVSKLPGRTLVSGMFKKYFRFRSIHDVLDLPPFHEKVFKVDSGIDISKKIKELEEEMNITITDEYEQPHITHALQMANGIDFETKEVTNLVKYNLIKELIEDIDESEPILIWTYWQAYGEFLLKTLKKDFPKLGIDYIYGGTAKKKRQDILEGFKNKKIKILIASQGTISEGHNLQHCHYSIFANVYYDSLKYDQCVGRIYRNGQTKKTINYVILGKGTLEEKAYHVLKRKRSLRSAKDYLNGVLTDKLKRKK